MKRLWWVALALAALLLLALAVTGCRRAATQGPQVGAQSASAVAEPTIYTCPMHPEVLSDQPGECPQCGMALVPQGEEAAAHDCCEEDAVAHPSAGHADSHGDHTYVCPMHPEVTSDKADARCPECGMFLEPKPEKTPAAKEAQRTAPKAAPTAKPAAATDESAAAEPPSQQKVTYVCPMHPEVTSEQPGRCPECNMFLEARS